MKLFAVALGGIIFGAGLAWSGMTQPEIVIDFLQFDDLGLILVMGGAVAVTLPAYQLIRRPLLADKPQEFRASIAPDRWLGSIIFGIGWGVSGVCPGAAFASLGTGNAPILVALAAMFLGSLAQGWIRDRANPSSTTADPSRHGPLKSRKLARS